MLSRFHPILERYGQTDGQMDHHIAWATKHYQYPVAISISNPPACTVRYS